MEIGEDCWLGLGVTVLPGVTIGKGCVIAAGAVVAKDVPPFSLAGGVPAKVIRHLGDLEEPKNHDEEHKLENAENDIDGLKNGDRPADERKANEDELSRKSDAGEATTFEADLPRWLKAPLKLA